jgi:hypothetical protein
MHARRHGSKTGAAGVSQLAVPVSYRGRRIPIPFMRTRSRLCVPPVLAQHQRAGRKNHATLVGKALHLRVTLLCERLSL